MAGEETGNQIGEMLGEVGNSREGFVDDSAEEEFEEPEVSEGEDEVAEAEGEEEVAEDSEEESEEETDELAQLREELQALKDQLADQRAPQTRQGPELDLEVPEFVVENDEDLEDAMTDPEKLKGLMTQIHKSAAMEGAQVVLKNLHRLIPGIMKSYSEAETLLSEFKANNTDLMDGGERQQKVSEAAVMLENEHPNWPKSRILEEAAKRVRIALNIPKSGPEGGTKPKKKMTTQKPRSSRRGGGTKKLSGVEKEIADMLDAINP